LKALLLAAGLGTRLRPLTETIPKCLVGIHDKPLLAYWLDLLLPNGISQALINTHHLERQVREFRERSPWRDRITLVHEPVLLGTGGTILANRSFFDNAPFLVAHADNLTRFRVAEFILAHRERPRTAAITMMTFETDAPQSSGIVETDSLGVVQRFHEKVPHPPGKRANAAVYIIEPEVVDFLAAIGMAVIDFSTQVIPHFLGRIATFHNTDYHRDIGSRESLLAAEREYCAIEQRSYK
jgi:mannose-1-phosphate guanylyltransferase